GGALLITEAGGLIGDLVGNETYLQTGNLVAGTPKVFAQLLQVIDAHRPPGLPA
ncbi:MAG: inositol monophosphatase, partial [Candidatus Accumulibacter sp.]|nr:inositol monophosphatase [Accumulibacter sp.]